MKVHINSPILHLPKNASLQATMREIDSLMKCCANADGIISRQSFQDGILNSQLMIRFFERLGLDVQNDLDELFDVVDKDRAGFLAYDKIASLYMELQNIMSHPMKVAVIRGAKDAEERLGYIARMLEHGSIVRPTPGELEDLLRNYRSILSDRVKNISNGQPPTASTVDPDQPSTPIDQLSAQELTSRKLALVDQLAREYARHAEAVERLSSQAEMYDQCLNIRM